MALAADPRFAAVGSAPERPFHSLGLGIHAVQVSAVVKNTASSHEVEVRTAGVARLLAVPRKPSGRGSAVNGGEFLMLALATCYCNDLFREAARLGIGIDSAEVEATGEFAGVGLAATNVTYRAKLVSPASEAQLAQLLRETDAVAEVHNTLRAGVPVELRCTPGEQPAAAG